MRIRHGQMKGIAGPKSGIVLLHYLRSHAKMLPANGQDDKGHLRHRREVSESRVAPFDSNLSCSDLD